MITNLTHTFIYVLNQDESLKFYTEVLGFDLKANFPLGPDKKWISVTPPKQSNLEIVLMKATEGPFFTKKNILKLFDKKQTINYSPPFYGSTVTIFATKK